MKKMKNSNIPWIGEIPEGWEVGKMLYALAMPITDGPHETPELFDEGIPFLSAEAVKNGKLNFDLKRGNISTDFYQECCKKYIPKRNDIFMIKSGATTGNIAIVETDEIFQIWSPLAVFRVNKNSYYKYLYFLLSSESIQKQIQLNWSYGTQQNIGMRVLEKLHCIMPPLSEQQKIADYLDKKTALIEERINIEKEQITKLKEYRKSLISEAVTKGLDTNAKLKDSSIEWIGEIPEGWEVQLLKRGGQVVSTGGTPSGASEEYYMEKGFPWYTPSDFNNETILPLNTKRALSSLGQSVSKIYPKNTVYIIGIGATIGKVGLSLHEASCNQQINAIICKSLVPKYLCYYLTILKDYILKCGKFTTLPILNQEETKNFIIPFFPLSEQQKIADYLDTKTSEIDKAISQKEMLIEKLGEYKKSLIYEVVTGKMEV